MATSTINKTIPKLNHIRILYSASSPTVVTNGSQTIRTGTFEKARNDTTLLIDFMCTGYTDSLSGGFHFYIDGNSVAEAITIFTSKQNTIVSQGFVEGINAGTHTYSIVISTQGNNTFTVPSWASSVITVSELL